MITKRFSSGIFNSVETGNKVNSIPESLCLSVFSSMLLLKTESFSKNSEASSFISKRDSLMSNLFFLSETFNQVF